MWSVFCILPFLMCRGGGRGVNEAGGRPIDAELAQCDFLVASWRILPICFIQQSVSKRFFFF